MLDIVINVFLGGIAGTIFGFFIGAKWILQKFKKKQVMIKESECVPCCEE